MLAPGISLTAGREVSSYLYQVHSCTVLILTDTKKLAGYLWRYLHLFKYRVFLSTVTNKSSITDTTVYSPTQHIYVEKCVHARSVSRGKSKVGFTRKKGGFSGMALVDQFSAGLI